MSYLARFARSFLRTAPAYDLGLQRGMATSAASGWKEGSIKYEQAVGGVDTESEQQRLNKYNPEYSQSKSRPRRVEADEFTNDARSMQSQDALSDQVKDGWEDTKKAMKDAKRETKQSTKEAWNDVKSAASEIKDAGQSKAADAWGDAKDMAKVGKEKVDRAWDSAKENVKEAKQDAKEGWQSTKKEAGKAWDSAKKNINEAKQDFQEVKQNLNSGLKDAKEDLQAGWKDAKEQTKKAFSSDKKDRDVQEGAKLRDNWSNETTSTTARADRAWQNAKRDLAASSGSNPAVETRYYSSSGERIQGTDYAKSMGSSGLEKDANKSAIDTMVDKTSETLQNAKDTVSEATSDIAGKTGDFLHAAKEKAVELKDKVSDAMASAAETIGLKETKVNQIDRKSTKFN